MDIHMHLEVELEGGKRDCDGVNGNASTVEYGRHH